MRWAFPGRRHFVFSCSPVLSRHGPGVLTVAVDTTAQVEAMERAEELSRERYLALRCYEALLSAVPQIVWLMKPDGAITELVGGFEEFTGNPWRPVIDAEWLGTVHPYDRPGCWRPGGTPLTAPRRSSRAPSGCARRPARTGTCSRGRCPSCAAG